MIEAWVIHPRAHLVPRSVNSESLGTHGLLWLGEASWSKHNKGWYTAYTVPGMAVPVVMPWRLTMAIAGCSTCVLWCRSIKAICQLYFLLDGWLGHMSWSQLWQQLTFSLKVFYRSQVYPDPWMARISPAIQWSQGAPSLPIQFLLASRHWDVSTFGFSHLFGWDSDALPSRIEAWPWRSRGAELLEGMRKEVAFVVYSWIGELVYHVYTVFSVLL